MRLQLGFLVVTLALIGGCGNDQTGSSAPAPELDMQGSAPPTKAGSAAQNDLAQKTDKPGEKREPSEVDGKKVFEASCAACHSATAGGVPAPDGKNVTDLSGASAKYDAPWLKRYLKREDRIGEEKHPTRMRGDEVDLDVLVSWLISLKPPAKDK